MISMKNRKRNIPRTCERSDIMKIKYFGNMKDDNGNIWENTRSAFIYFKDSEKCKFSAVYKALIHNGYKCTLRYLCDGANEFHFHVNDRDDFEDLKEIYMQVKSGKPSEC